VKKQKKQIQKTKNYDIVKLRMRRFIAMIIDWYMTNIIAAIPVTFYLRGNDYIHTYSFDLETYGFSTGLMLGLFVIIMAIIYYLIIPTYIWKGQTLGKKICKICIIEETGHEVSFKNMFLREIIGAVFLEGGIVITATYIRKLIQLYGYISIVTPLKYISYAITISSIIYAYFNPLSQSFHDKLARTCVIKKD